MARQRQAGSRMGFGVRKTLRIAGNTPTRLLHVDGNRIMNQRVDTFCLEMSLQVVAVLAGNDEQVMCVPFVIARQWQNPYAWDGDSARILSGNFATTSYPLPQKW